MAITVGIDTYVTLAEADAYVAANYLSTDEPLVRWNALISANKEVALRRAASGIELLPFVGKKSLLDQVMAFPRYPSSVVPSDVKAAQIEQALESLDPAYQGSIAANNDLVLRGVTSYRIGKLSETFKATSSLNMVSIKTAGMLEKYTRGGYNICP